MRSGINGWDYACSKTKNIFEWALNVSLIDDKTSTILCFFRHNEDKNINH